MTEDEELHPQTVTAAVELWYRDLTLMKSTMKELTRTEHSLKHDQFNVNWLQPESDDFKSGIH